MRYFFITLILLCVVFSAHLTGFCSSADQEASKPAKLTDAQKEAGWQLLFDGISLKGWRNYKREGPPQKGWLAENGCLRLQPGGQGGDIMTMDQFKEFDFMLEWKVSERANSGIIYLVSEHEDAPWKTGPEYQILDDLGHGIDITDSHSAGGAYDLYRNPAHKKVKPAGEWNLSRIVKRGSVVEHWLNGIQLVEFDLASEEWAKHRDKSKFSRYPRFGKNSRGYISLQDHGHEIWFRNIKIRDHSPKPDIVKTYLFNGADMTGWKHFLPGGEKMEGTWNVADGVLICKGQPIGYIYTEKEFTNFNLKLEWRFNPITKKAGNSGVLFRRTGPHEVWPKSVEAQLQSGSAGDFWCIGEFPMKTVAERTRGRNTRKTHGNEHPIGEWNEYEIIVDHGNVTLIVNGEVLNKAWDVAETPGNICLQSEGAEIHFRKIRLERL